MFTGNRSEQSGLSIIVHFFFLLLFSVQFFVASISIQSSDRLCYEDVPHTPHSGRAADCCRTALLHLWVCDWTDVIWCHLPALLIHCRLFDTTAQQSVTDQNHILHAWLSGKGCHYRRSETRAEVCRASGCGVRNGRMASLADRPLVITVLSSRPSLTAHTDSSKRQQRRLSALLIKRQSGQCSSPATVHLIGWLIYYCGSTENNAL